MSIKLQNLKESNSFLNILYNNLNSAIFLIDSNLNVLNVNDSFKILFKKKENIIGHLCGEVIGCGFITDEGKTCGSTTHCGLCEIRKSIKETFTNRNGTEKNIVARKFYIGEEFFYKYFQIVTRHLYFDNKALVMLIVDDITENKKYKLEIKEKNKEITDSIRYARNIQLHTLPNDEDIRSGITDYFVLFKPKDIVSGDFYWNYNISSMKYFAVADCTGHGVPGAFLSMLGISILNRIMEQNKMPSPSEIIDQLRNHIIELLNHKDLEWELHDGMDISLIALDTKTKICQYAGANNSLIVTKNNSGIPTIDEIKPDKMPVGSYHYQTPFTNHTFKLDHGDIIYLRTDGYEDQFGESNNKKFMAKKLKELILTICNESVSEQKNILFDTFNEWKGTLEQLDDVTIIGLKM